MLNKHYLFEFKSTVYFLSCFLTLFSEEIAYHLRHCTLVVYCMCLHYLLLLLLGELHSLEHNTDQILLDLRVLSHEVRHQNVLEILRVDLVGHLLRQLLRLLFAVIHQLVVFTLQLIELLGLGRKLLLQSVLLLLCNLLVFDEFITRGLPFCLLLAKPVLRLGMLLQEAHHSSLEEIHDVITHLHHKLV